MGKTAVLLIVTLALLSAAFMSRAEVLIPQPADQYINDFAGVITATDKSSISAMLRQVSQKTGVFAAVVTVKSVDGYAPGLDPETFAVGIFNTWKLEEKTGKAMLIFVSIKDRQVTMELGSAKPGFYDTIMQKVVKARMLPNFKEGDYGRGIYDGVRTLSKILLNQAPFVDYTNKYLPIAGPALVLLLIIIIAVVIPKKNNKSGQNKPGDKPEKKQPRQKKETQDIFGGGAAGGW